MIRKIQILLNASQAPIDGQKGCKCLFPLTGREENIEWLKTTHLGRLLARAETYHGLKRAILNIEDVNSSKIGPLLIKCQEQK